VLPAITNKRQFLILFFFLLIIAGVLFFRPLNLILLFFSNIFFHGTSDAKLISFLFYLLIFFLIDLFYQSKKKKLKINSAKLQKIIYLLIIILIGSNFFSYFAYTNKYRLSFSHYSLMAYKGVYESAAYPLHIHTFKPAVNLILPLLGIDRLSGYGTGLPFLNTLPFYFYFLSFLLSCFLLVLLIYYGIQISKKHHQGNFYKFVYCLFSFGVLKAIFDGGLLWFEFAINLAFFYFLNRYSKKNVSKAQFLKSAKIVALLSLIFNLIYFSLQSIIRTSPSRIDLVNFITPSLSLTSCSLGIYFLSSQKKQFKKLALFFLLTGLILQLDGRYAKALRYGLINIPLQRKTYITSVKNLPLKTVRKEGNWKVYQYSSNKQQKIIDLIIKHKLRLSYFPVNVDGINCAFNESTRRSAKVIVLEEKRRNNPPPSSIFFEEFEMQKIDNAPSLYLVNYQVKGCTARITRILTNHLYHLGFERFIISGLWEI